MATAANESPLPARTAVLGNQELLANIFQHHLPWNPQTMQRNALREGRMQLRDHALTCKAFKDPALNYLWSYMESLAPFVKTLPNVHIVDNAYVDTAIQF